MITIKINLFFKTVPNINKALKVLLSKDRNTPINTFIKMVIAMPGYDSVKNN